MVNVNHVNFTQHFWHELYYKNNNNNKFTASLKQCSICKVSILLHPEEYWWTSRFFLLTQRNQQVPPQDRQLSSFHVRHRICSVKNGHHNILKQAETLRFHAEAIIRHLYGMSMHLRCEDDIYIENCERSTRGEIIIWFEFFFLKSLNYHEKAGMSLI